MNFYSQADPERDLGSGLADIDAGLRLRYEITRKVAPYIGVTYAGKFGGTADFARACGPCDGRGPVHPWLADMVLTNGRVFPVAARCLVVGESGPQGGDDTPDHHQVGEGREEQLPGTLIHFHPPCSRQTNVRKSLAGCRGAMLRTV